MDKIIVYFDYDCAFCRWCVAFVLKRSQKFVFHSIARIGENPELTQRWDGYSILLVTGEDRAEGGKAATRILKEIGGVWGLGARILEILRIESISYRFLAWLRLHVPLPRVEKEELLSLGGGRVEP